jgi:hypothetical protein
MCEIVASRPPTVEALFQPRGLILLSAENGGGRSITVGAEAELRIDLDKRLVLGKEHLAPSSPPQKRFKKNSRQLGCTAYLAACQLKHNSGKPY